MNKKIIIYLSILAIIVISSGLILDKYSEMSFENRNNNNIVTDNNPSALLDILGELRYTAAALLWMKVDYYNHEYEFRGFDYRTNESLMPLIRLITILDPHFVQAYDFGAYHLAVNLNKREESMKFLKEGLTNNPDSFELNWEYGFLFYFNKKYSESLPFLMKARTLRSQKTPVYEDWLKMVWIDSRIIKILQANGRNEEAKLYIKEINDYVSAVYKEELETAKYILENPYVSSKK